jgi:putative PIN family toxin of toxin-antitoxin system
VIVVLDTNVLLAALVARGLCHEVVQRCLRAHAAASSPALLDELEATLRGRFPLTVESQAFLKQLRAHIRLVEPRPLRAAVCRDPDDDVVLATAVAAGAEAIITGDEDLLVLKAYKRVRILTPRQFLESNFGHDPSRE